MFYKAAAFEQDISNWNVGQVQDASYMLDDCQLTNYDALLTKWSLQPLKSGVELGAAGLIYHPPFEKVEPNLPRLMMPHRVLGLDQQPPFGGDFAQPLLKVDKWTITGDLYWDNVVNYTPGPVMFLPYKFLNNDGYRPYCAYGMIGPSTTTYKGRAKYTNILIVGKMVTLVTGEIVKIIKINDVTVTVRNKGEKEVYQSEIRSYKRERFPQPSH